MIEVLNLTEIMELALKITLIFYGVFVFYLFGKFEKIPYSARQTIFVIGNGGCLFLAGGLITSNLFLIKGGIFILSKKPCTRFAATPITLITSSTNFTVANILS